MSGASSPGYDIFLATDDGKIEKRLTDAPGYDAEATVNWKTGRMVYTSLASGDLDLWTMRTDGSDKKQITRNEGYDGGAVFSRDGKKLVWRANYPKTAAQMDRYKTLLADNLTAPMKMEIMVGDADGRNAHPITEFRLRQLRPYLYARRQEDPVRLQQARVRQPQLRAIHDQRGWHRPGAGDRLRRLHFLPRVFAGRQDSGLLLRPRRQGSRYEFNIFTATWSY